MAQLIQEILHCDVGTQFVVLIFDLPDIKKQTTELGPAYEKTNGSKNKSNG